MDTTLKPPELGQIYETVCGKLAATFPEAAAVLGANRLRGFSRKENRHILLVEVIWRLRVLEPLAKGPSDGGLGDSRTTVPHRLAGVLRGGAGSAHANFGPRRQDRR